MTVDIDALVSTYRDQPVNWGYGALSEVVYRRTYSRDGEQWADTCGRVMRGLLQEHERFGVELDDSFYTQMYDDLWNLRWSPPGRGLWMMGTPFVHERRVVEALQNCAFTSTENCTGDTFRWFMEMLMLGVGVGFDTKGAGVPVPAVDSRMTYAYSIDDTREGWADSVRILVDAYLEGSMEPSFYYGRIRPAGSPISGFGGVASGPQPLIELHNALREVFKRRMGSVLTSRDITDICNLIGKCVVAGNVRRSAEIAIGDADDEEFLLLKDYEVYPERASFGWTSNNSVVADATASYRHLAEATYRAGEPGYIWFENVRRFGRMGESRQDNAVGANPCVEQFLAHREMCTLAEVYAPRCETYEVLERQLHNAYIYAKTVTMMSATIHDETSRNIMQANRRMGISLTGVAQFIDKYGYEALISAADTGYNYLTVLDRTFSAYHNIPESIRLTTVKPGGTVCLLAGVTPGVHFAPMSRYHIRRVTIAGNSPLVQPLIDAGYRVEPSVVDSSAVIVEFPIDAQAKGEDEAALEEQVYLAELMQRYWSDNGVSFTAKFDRSKTTVEDLAEVIAAASKTHKAISFLPLEDHGYAQAPYEKISEEEVRRLQEGLKAVDFSGVTSAIDSADLYCEGDACLIQNGEA